MTLAAPGTGRAAARTGPPEPSRDCPFCPRLADYRSANRKSAPDWHNGPVPSFGDPDARLLIVGLAPGLKGANRTGRPFTGDFAGELLFATLLKFGFAAGRYGARADDGLGLVDAMITNALRCAPPQNRPEGAEIAACRPFLAACIAALPNLAAIVCLGRIAHDATLAALGLRKSAAQFAHGARHDVDGGRIALFDSYHCSRYNTNTGRLTADMFEAVFSAARGRLGEAQAGPARLATRRRD